MVESPPFITTKEKPSAITFSLHPLVEAIRSTRPPIRNRRYYLAIPTGILSTIGAFSQSFREWQGGSVESALVLGAAAVTIAFFATHKLLNRFHRLENS